MISEVEGNELIYNPPAWRVCKCNGGDFGWNTKDGKQPEGHGPEKMTLLRKRRREKEHEQYIMENTETKGENLWHIS